LGAVPDPIGGFVNLGVFEPEAETSLVMSAIAPKTISTAGKFLFIGVHPIFSRSLIRDSQAMLSVPDGTP
jgi:hypothetical protein